MIGGHVYRGQALPELRGRYVFGTLGRSPVDPRARLLVASDPTADPDDLWPLQRIAIAGAGQYYVNHFLKGIGRDQQGELYLMVADELGPTGTSGQLLRLEAPNRSPRYNRNPCSASWASACAAQPRLASRARGRGVQDAADPDAVPGERRLRARLGELADADHPLGLERRDERTQVAIARGVQRLALARRGSLSGVRFLPLASMNTSGQ